MASWFPAASASRSYAAATARVLEQAEPGGEVREAQLELASELTADLRRADVQLRETRKKLVVAIRACGSTVTEVFGIGPVVAATVIGDQHSITFSDYGTHDDHRLSRTAQLVWDPLERAAGIGRPARLPAGRQGADTAGRVAAEPFVALSAACEFRAISHQLCVLAGFCPVVSFEAGEVATVRVLAGAGLGIAILSALRQPAASGAPARLAIGEQDASGTLGLAWTGGWQLAATAEPFRAWLISAALSWQW